MIHNFHERQREKRKERALWSSDKSGIRHRARRSRGFAPRIPRAKSRDSQRRPMKPKRETSCRLVALSRSTSREPEKSRSTFSAWFITLSIARSRGLAYYTRHARIARNEGVRDRTLRRKKLGFFAREPDRVCQLETTRRIVPVWILSEKFVEKISTSAALKPEKTMMRKVQDRKLNESLFR